ncbi:MAG: nascent polypeptide-associated complex protein [Candidatus Heimdallarchaeaceae archaeon]
MGTKRPLSPREMKRLRGKMKTIELDGVEEVIIRMKDKEIVIPNPEVSKIVLGGEIYQVIGTGIERPITTKQETTPAPKITISDADIKLVAEQAGVSEELARKAIEEENGDLAAAIVRLKTKKH